MKIGILTFHSQLNYGGVLQCWALKETLKCMGHEVVVVDRWLTPDNALLNGPFGGAGLKGWCKIVLRLILGCGGGYVLRCWRTRRFVKSLGLTPYHFYDWKDAPNDLGVDCLVVGSDQVWHSGDWGFPDARPYLLDGAPKLRAIGYAASFGMKALPSGIDYAAGFRRFQAISVREAEGSQLVASTGYSNPVPHVVDPTLLLPCSEWIKLASDRKKRQRMTCYFLSENVPSALGILEPWARARNITVDVLSDYAPRCEFPRSLSALLHRIVLLIASLTASPHVRLRTGCGPREFVRAFARSEMVISDSYHAVMFSLIFDCNIRFLRPQDEMRCAMFARVEEISGNVTNGKFIVENLRDALDSFDACETVSFRRESLRQRILESWSWLDAALRKMDGCKMEKCDKRKRQ